MQELRTLRLIHTHIRQVCLSPPLGKGLQPGAYCLPQPLERVCVCVYGVVGCDVAVCEMWYGCVYGVVVCV